MFFSAHRLTCIVQLRTARGRHFR
ncbi:Protein of unknown function [Pyronema omphalodes CBS 100304]|uniref:Uncharacterized protein n=1 Tax=Pyronema omphalodes (strain CBS 100304) TaxID=1076935 RepID=U4KZT2_PYROM|nr:Protein of unknown function [Pyronema omphalodes CBS 100304]